MTDQEEPSKRLRGFDPRGLYQNGGPRPGEADLIVGGESDQVVGRMFALILMALRTEDGKFPFSGINVIAPPTLVWDRSDDHILRLILDAVHDLRGTPADSQEVTTVRRLLSVTRCDGLDINDLVNAVRPSGRQVLLIPKAGQYRDSAISVHAPGGRTGVLIAEDLWVPHVASLAKGCIDIASSMGSYLILEVSESPPVRDSNEKMLEDVDDLYVTHVHLEGETDAGKLVLENASKWAGMAATGRFQEVLAELDAANLNGSYRAQLAIQIAARTGDDELIGRTIRSELERGTKFPPEFAVRIGRIAERAGQSDIAAQFLDDGIEHVSDQGILEGALMSCTSLAIPELVERAFERLAAIFPSSEALRANRELRLMQLCDFEVPSTSRVGFTDIEEFLAHAVSKEANPNYEQLLAIANEKWPSQIGLALICCAIHAQARGDLPNALTLAMSATNAPEYEYQAVNLILGVMHRLMLLEAVRDEEIELYKVPLQRIIRYLAKNPGDGSTRVVLTGVLSVESCGEIGLPLIASLTLDIAQEGVRVAPNNHADQTRASDEMLTTFLKQALSWLKDHPAVEIGVTRLPQELAGENPKGLINALTRLVHYGATQRDDNADVLFVEQCAYLVCMLKPYVPEENADIEVLRMLAGLYWFEGRPQKSRDLAEQILELAGKSSVRHRIAWAAFSDIYQRASSPVDALLGISCAFACDTPVDLADLWQETYTLLRIARDLNLYPVARGLLPTCRKLLEQLGWENKFGLRMETIELGLRFRDLRGGGTTTLSELVGDLTIHCAKIMESKEDPLPAAALLGQSIGLLEHAGIAVSTATRDGLRHLLDRMGPQAAEYIRLLSATRPSLSDVIGLHNRLDEARYCQDRPGDFVAVVMAARRLLDTNDALTNPERLLLAIELLAEKAVEPIAGAQILDEEWPCTYAKKLGSEGMAVVMLGLDNKGELVAVLSEGGALEVRRAPHENGNFRRRLEEWRTKYPLRYGHIERGEGNNEFYETMRPLDIPLPVADTVIVVAEPELQQIPLNLVLHDDEFAGKTKAIGYAPSLTWLEAVRRNSAKHDGRRLAWLSASDNPDEAGTFEWLLGRIGPTLDQYAFHTNTQRQIPEDFIGSEIAIVVAHGGLTAAGRFIHRISDEGMLTESPVALARSLANIELVILFVCSGGRMDTHPYGNTSVGLPRLLLARGCRTVIASPWPLAPSVVGHWLDGFLEAWEKGESALVADFRANQLVEARLGDPPQYVFAMSVYGDVLLRKRSAERSKGESH